MQANKQHRKTIGKLSVVTCVLIFSMACRAEELPLLNRATLIASLSGTNIRYFNGGVYCWVSENKVIILRDRSHNPPDSFTRIFLRDLLTKKEIYLKKLSNWFNGGGAGLTSKIEMSSDGKWLLWVNEAEDDGFHGIYGSTLNGIKRFQIQNYEAAVSWIPDSLQWLALESNDNDQVVKARVRGVDGKVANTIRFSPTYLGSDDVYNPVVVRENKTLYLLVLHEEKHSGKLNILKYRLDKKRTIVQTIPVPVSDASQFRTDRLEFSPDRKYIAWTVEDLHRSSSKSLWISDLNRSTSYKLGQLNGIPEDEWSRFAFGVRWSPDGKRLSFIYKNALWSVPAFKSNSAAASGNSSKPNPLSN